MYIYIYIQCKCLAGSHKDGREIIVITADE
jgi:hypothetical protein